LNVFLAPKIDGLKRVQLVDLGLLIHRERPAAQIAPPNMSRHFLWRFFLWFFPSRPFLSSLLLSPPSTLTTYPLKSAWRHKVKAKT
jgi:hypothetical protein